jgi:lipopolysaccharide heptosyltransferase I
MNLPSHRPPRFLITRLSAIGDCILTLPLAVALKRQFPKAWLSWVVEGAAATLIEGHPAVDEVIRVRKGFLRSPSTAVGLWQQLRERQFDVVIDPQGLTKSAVVGWASGAKERIGFARPIGRELSPWLNRTLVAPQTTHLVDRQLELLGPLGVSNPSIEFRVPQYLEVQHNVQAILARPELRQGFALINPGAGWDSKLWPWERFAELVKQLGGAAGLKSLVIWNGPREECWAQDIVQASAGWALKAPPTKLRELAELCRAARLFISSDTGPLHLAAAVGTSCVGLYGPTRPELCGPYGAHATAIQAWYQDGTSRERRNGRNDALRDIAVEPVLAACQRLLSAAQRSAA